MGNQTTINVDDFGAPSRAAIPTIENRTIPAESATETLLKTIAVDGRVTLPIDVEAVIKALGLQMESLPLTPTTDGLLVKPSPNEPFKAVVNNASHEHRRRFTYAHEIGHFVHKYQDYPEDEKTGLVERRDELSSKGIDPEEIWANRFAAALLMPASIVRHCWGEGRTRDELADMFNVSRRAMDLRIATLGLE
ncbi:ImmA/IrrE family metallo-endopeptidase [Bifidobacterium samirii]|uniref:Toxin-antitoxin system toxin component n=1 Tax=Bifidobacterium samirii TaxID=2306974 RepID=A0A430FU94_9BIFI|nr:ImmA/IrrE family metallo-endopeptidase [Bifidobacterium samirii]RSX56731.1 toxin-antitoxin system toxin component [Bifidobacterium samirii]